VRRLAFNSAVVIPVFAVYLCAASVAQAQAVASQTRPHSARHAPATPTAQKPAIEFENTIIGSKIKFVLRNSASPQRYTIETMVGGVALFDYNNDGLLDMFFTNGAAIPSFDKSEPVYWNRLYRNNGDGTFTDVTEKAGVTGIIPKAGKAWSVAAGWVDYNNDGHLDLFVVDYLSYSLKTATLCVDQGHPAYCSPVDFLGTPNILYRNNGDGTFTDVSEQSHVSQYVGKGMGVSFADYDNDGFTDIFVSNDTFQNFLLRNNGDGTFTEVGVLAGVAYNGFGNAVAGMGTDFRDIDNDGKPDIFETAMFGEGFPIYRNLGDGQFEDVSGAAGLTRYASHLTAWGAGVFDFDNDSLKDLFTSDADILDNSMELAHRPYALQDGIFRNRGNLIFEDLSAKAGPSFVVPAAHRGAAFGDLNNDGRIDAVVAVLNGAPEIMMNRTTNANHWILLNLVGVKSNRDGLGAKVKITTALGLQYNQATTAVGYNSSSDKRVHFGLGSATSLDRIEIAWPSGIKQVLTNVKADQILTVKEAATEASGSGGGR
jgi:hypothetical protein